MDYMVIPPARYLRTAQSTSLCWTYLTYRTHKRRHWQLLKLGTSVSRRYLPALFQVLPLDSSRGLRRLTLKWKG